MARPVPDWVLTEWFTDVDLGVLKTGKEAEIRVVERAGLDGEGRHLLAQKRYRPRKIDAQGPARGARLRAGPDVPQRPRVPRRPQLREALPRPPRRRADDELRQGADQAEVARATSTTCSAPCGTPAWTCPIRCPSTTRSGLFLEYLGDDERRRPAPGPGPPRTRRSWRRRGTSSSSPCTASSAPDGCTPTCRPSTCSGGTTACG